MHLSPEQKRTVDDLLLESESPRIFVQELTQLEMNVAYLQHQIAIMPTLRIASRANGIR